MDHSERSAFAREINRKRQIIAKRVDEERSRKFMITFSIAVALTIISAVLLCSLM
jgi:hypothetical protein